MENKILKNKFKYDGEKLIINFEAQIFTPNLFHKDVEDMGHLIGSIDNSIVTLSNMFDIYDDNFEWIEQRFDVKKFD